MAAGAAVVKSKFGFQMFNWGYVAGKDSCGPAWSNGEDVANRLEASEGVEKLPIFWDEASDGW